MPIRRALILSSVRATSSGPASTVRTPGHGLSNCATSHFRRTEFPHRKTSQSRGAATSPRRRAGTVFSAATKTSGSGRAAASCSLPEGASREANRTRPDSNDTGTVTSTQVASGAACGEHMDTRSAAAAKGDATKRTADRAAASWFRAPRIRSPPPRRRFNSDAVPAARLRFRDPTRTSHPAFARRSAIPRPSCPVPASTPSFTTRPRFLPEAQDPDPGSTPAGSRITAKRGHPHKSRVQWILSAPGLRRHGPGKLAGESASA